MAMIEVDEENFQEELDKAFAKKSPVILKFGSEYCNSCNALEWELEELDESSETIAILLIDTDESPELAGRYDVYALPTMVIYNEEKEMIYNKEGVVLAPEIEKIINQKKER